MKNTVAIPDITSVPTSIEIDPDESWQTIVQPFVDRYKIGALFQQQVVYGPVGCAFLAKVLTQMAAIIDTEIVARKKEHL